MIFLTIRNMPYRIDVDSLIQEKNYPWIKFPQSKLIQYSRGDARYIMTH